MAQLSRWTLGVVCIVIVTDMLHPCWCRPYSRGGLTKPFFHLPNSMFMVTLPVWCCFSSGNTHASSGIRLE